MDIQHLTYFAGVYQCLNYSKAAQMLYVSRQTLQQAVRYLERTIGFPLFEVGPAGLIPTPHGVALYEAAQKTLESFKEFEDTVAVLRTAELSPIRQGTITNIHDIMTAKEMQECHRRNFDDKDVHISASSDELRGMIRDGELDVAYLYGDASWSDGFVRVIVEAKRPLWLAVPARHRLAGRSIVHIADLEGESFLSMGRSYDIDKALYASCEAGGFVLTATCVSPDSHGLLAKVALGAGVTYRLTGAPSHSGVVCVPFDEAEITWDNYAIFRDGPLEENPAYRRFLGKQTVDTGR